MYYSTFFKYLPLNDTFFISILHCHIQQPFSPDFSKLIITISIIILVICHHYIGHILLLALLFAIISFLLLFLILLCPFNFRYEVRNDVPFVCVSILFCHAIYWR